MGKYAVIITHPDQLQEVICFDSNEEAHAFVRICKKKKAARFHEFMVELTEDVEVTWATRSLFGLH